MSELRQILSLWRHAQKTGEEICLATVIEVEGSSYRKAGARMLFTSGGRRAGTVSGGCLEAEIQKKGWWHTEKGSSLQSYSSFFDEDSEMPYGLGCGGTVHVLLERGAEAHAVLSAIERGVESRSAVVAVVQIGSGSAQTIFVSCGSAILFASPGHEEASRLAAQAAEEGRSVWSSGSDRLFAEYLAPPAGLFVIGAGDDAKPLVEFAYQLGWQITVADGRSHLATKDRFPLADSVSSTGRFGELPVSSQDAVVVLTHSYEQDRAALRALITAPCAYLGLLGSRRRTLRLVQQVAGQVGLTSEECLSRLHAPIGLDIGGTNPATIALAICAEIQGVLHRGRSLQTAPAASACA
ncbi:XdhC family protein [Silvibacterium acidisoli]|uniref:XdhC family protein n=1 Tax=Acidobacteriaceae bacterium ZG23-2 TaxID=2883246 RepID=UPI00406C6238